MTCRVEIIAVGSELIWGSKLDTNSQWISDQLHSNGFFIQYHTTLPDQFESQIQHFKIACARSDLIVVTGGLGPTDDDLTRHILAEISGQELERDQAMLAYIQNIFLERGSPMPRRNERQAEKPKSALFIPNANGTAPGLWIEVIEPSTNHKTLVLSFPGVPRELKAMLTLEFIQKLKKFFNLKTFTESKIIHTFGLGESMIEELIDGITARDAQPEVGITASEGVISLRIVARGGVHEATKLQIENTTNILRKRLGNLIFGKNEDSLASVAASLLKECQKKITIEEDLDGSGGALSLLLNQSGGEDCIEKALLKKSATIDDYLNKDGLSIIVEKVITTSPNEIVNQGSFVRVNIVDQRKLFVTERRLLGSRGQWQRRCAYQALDALRRHLLNLPLNPTI